MIISREPSFQQAEGAEGHGTGTTAASSRWNVSMDFRSIVVLGVTTPRVASAPVALVSLFPLDGNLHFNVVPQIVCMHTEVWETAETVPRSCLIPEGEACFSPACSPLSGSLD